MGVPERSLIMGYRDEQLYTLLCARQVAGQWERLSNGDVASMLGLANARQGSRYIHRLVTMGLAEVKYTHSTVRWLRLVPQDMDVPFPRAGDVYELLSTRNTQEKAQGEADE